MQWMTRFCQIWLALYFSVFAHSATGIVLRDESSAYEIKLLPNENRVKVFSIEEHKPLSKEASLTMLSRTTADKVALYLVEPKDSVPHYEGVMDPRAGSYIGFELMIPIDGKRGKKLKSANLSPSVSLPNH